VPFGIYVVTREGGRMRQAFARRRLALLAGAAAVVAVAAGTAVAAFPDDNVTTYTGCLLNGNINSVKAGDSPTKACPAPATAIKLSGGDITSVNVEAPLKQVSPSTGLNGKVTIGLDSKATLPTGCSDGQLVRWDGTNQQWVCRDKYANGPGLDLTTDKTFSVKPSFRLPQSCSDGTSPVWNDDQQIWECQQYVRPSTCTSGQFATGANSSGTITCAAPSAVNLNHFDEVATDGGIKDDGAWHDFVNVKLDIGGTYLLIAKGKLTSTENVDSFKDASCSIRQNANVRDEMTAHAGTLNEVTDIPFSLTAVLTVGSGDEITLSCEADEGADGVGLNQGRITGVRIGP
jgi:hypothetical protein